MHGVLNLVKPPGMTSHDAVAFVRRVLKTRRVGHTGTLDPAAAGVLPICVGQATRLVEYLQAEHKVYETEATFGFETDTLDRVGTLVRESDGSTLTEGIVRETLKSFHGRIEQVPPMHSAIKVGGQKLYELARAGEEVEIPRRTVDILGLTLERFVVGPNPKAWMRIECSGGTYVRSLVRDIAYSVGSVATMTFLVRTQSGQFMLDSAVTCEKFASHPGLIGLEEVLMTLTGQQITDDALALAFLQGKRVAVRDLQVLSSSSTAKPLLVSNEAKTLFALVVECEGSSGVYRAEKVFDLR